MRKNLLVLILCLLVLTPILAVDEDALFGSSFDDDLFGGDDFLVEDISETEIDLEQLMLTDEAGITLGGSYSFSITPGWSWNLDNETDTGTLATDLSAKLFFDARPSADMRVFGKAVISYPFDEIEDDPGTPLVNEQRTFSDILSIKELFSDFSIHDRLFLRVGKQTLNWGVGYFFSPADLLNLSEIDPSDPDKELEGPLSVKMNMPLGIDNLYGYVMVPEDAKDITDVAVAVKYEKVIGKSELGFGAYYRNGQAPAAMVTLSSGIGDVSLFGEGMLSYGSDKKYQEKGSFPPTYYENPDDRFYFSATAGANFTWNDKESDRSVTFATQYYYNGEGTNLNTVILIPFQNNGYHYGATSLSFALTRKVTLGLFWYGNMEDLSGMVKPSVTWKPVDSVGINLTLNATYGDLGDEFTPLFGQSLGRTLGVSLGFTLGGANF